MTPASVIIARHSLPFPGRWKGLLVAGVVASLVGENLVGACATAAATAYGGMADHFSAPNLPARRKLRGAA